MTEVSTKVQINTENSLEKLQDGRDHLCYGLHAGILVTATHNPNNLRLEELLHFFVIWTGKGSISTDFQKAWAFWDSASKLLTTPWSDGSNAKNKFHMCGYVTINAALTFNRLVNIFFAGEQFLPIPLQHNTQSTDVMSTGLFIGIMLIISIHFLNVFK